MIRDICGRTNVEHSLFNVDKTTSRSANLDSARSGLQGESQATMPLKVGAVQKEQGSRQIQEVNKPLRTKHFLSFVSQSSAVVDSCQ